MLTLVARRRYVCGDPGLYLLFMRTTPWQQCHSSYSTVTTIAIISLFRPFIRGLYAISTSSYSYFDTSWLVPLYDTWLYLYLVCFIFVLCEEHIILYAAGPITAWPPTSLSMMMNVIDDDKVCVIIIIVIASGNGNAELQSESTIAIARVKSIFAYTRSIATQISG